MAPSGTGGPRPQMLDNRTFRPSPETARKWHALAERRRREYVELYRSGRWRRYYSEERFLAHLREVVQGVESWAKVVEQLSQPPAGRAPN
jgi:uncharacterized repeat protein (TIGR03809 family)